MLVNIRQINCSKNQLLFAAFFQQIVAREIRDDIYTNWIAQGVDFLSNTFPAKHIDFNCVLLNNLFNFKETDLHFFQTTGMLKSNNNM
jgi:hypothetical protein